MLWVVLPRVEGCCDASWFSSVGRGCCVVGVDCWCWSFKPGVADPAEEKTDELSRPDWVRRRIFVLNKRNIFWTALMSIVVCLVSGCGPGFSAYVISRPEGLIIANVCGYSVQSVEVWAPDSDGLKIAEYRVRRGIVATEFNLTDPGPSFDSVLDGLTELPTGRMEVVAIIGRNSSATVRNVIPLAVSDLAKLGYVATASLSIVGPADSLVPEILENVTCYNE